jgi:hypothetical protein
MVRVAKSLVFCVIFYQSLFVFLFFFFAIVLSVLRKAASGYLFGIFRLFNPIIDRY